LVQAMGWNPPTPGGQTFRDVPAGSPYFIFVEYVAGRSIISGYTCGGSGEPCPGAYFRAGLSGPVAPMVKFRIAGAVYDTDGYIENAYLHQKADPYRDWSVRGNLLFDPGGGWDIDLRAAADRLQTRALYFNIVSDVNDTHLPVQVNNPGQNDRDIYNLSGKISYAGNGFTATSITSYDTVKEILTGDAFDFLPITESFFYRPANSPFGFGLGLGFDLNQSQYLKVNALSEELRVQSPDKAKLFWMFGVYGIKTDRFISTGNMIDTGNGVFPVYRTISTNPLNPQFSFLSDSQDNFAWSGFGNLGYAYPPRRADDVCIDIR